MADSENAEVEQESNKESKQQDDSQQQSETSERSDESIKASFKSERYQESQEDFFSPARLKLLRVMARKALWLLAWCVCAGSMVWYAREIHLQFASEDPVTVVTYVDRNVFLRPTIKICNNVFIDPNKVLDYTGKEIPKDSYRFLEAAVRNEEDFNDTGFVFDTPVETLLLTSARVVDTFRLDIDDFMIACGDGPTYHRCSEEYEWVLEAFSGCYKSRHRNVAQVGAFHATTILMYFDPELNLGKYTSSLGAKVVVSHEDDQFSRDDGLFLAPNELLSLSAISVERTQDTTLEKSRCTYEQGIMTYNFTGEPFDVLYSPTACRAVCTSEYYYKRCDCSPIWGLNTTNSECLENEQKRSCILRLYKSESSQEDDSSVFSNCLNKCIRKCVDFYYELKVSRATQYPRGSYLEKELRNVVESGVKSQLAEKLLNKIETKQMTLEQVAVNTAQLNVVMEEDNLEKKVKISPLLTFPTFLSNLGGLLGMWLGLSVISLLQIGEGALLWTKKKAKVAGTKLSSRRPRCNQESES